MTLKQSIIDALSGEYTTPDEARSIAEDVLDSSTTASLPDNFVGSGDTIQGAHDSLGNDWTDSGRIIVLPSYDPTEESYPIQWSKRASLFGGNYTNLQPDSGQYALVVNIHDAPNNRPPGPTFHNLSVYGGRGGCKIEACRYSVWENIDVNDVEEDAFHVVGKDWGETAINTHHFYSCTQDGAGRDGWHIGMRAHGAHLFGCHSYFADRYGVYVDEATSCAMFGGSTEQASKEGLMIDGSHVFLAKSVYFEGSNPDMGGGADAHVTGDATTVGFENCYFNGAGKADWGARFYDCTNADIRNCEAWNYSRGFIYVDSGSSVDVHGQSHHIRDDTMLVGNGDGATIRSNGILVPQDLSTVEGSIEGEIGIHESGDEKYLSIWYDGSWHRHPGTTRVG